MKIYYAFYRWFMRLAHRYGWHYAPMRGPLEDGATQRWCQWCGFRETYHTQGNWKSPKQIIGHWKLTTPILTKDFEETLRYGVEVMPNETCRGCGTIGPLLRTET